MSAALWLAWPTVAAAQTVAGGLREEGTDRPIARARVELLTLAGASAGATLSDSAGAFALAAPAAGTYRVRVSRLGYRSQASPLLAVPGGQRVTLTLHLTPDTIALAPVVVSARATRARGALGGFYERMHGNAFGHFITRDQIEARHPTAITEVLRTVPGLSVARVAGGAGSSVLASEGCAPALYLNGVRVPLFDGTIDDRVDPFDVEAIEVYAHSSRVPVQFGIDHTCGAIVVWTKHGP